MQDSLSKSQARVVRNCTGLIWLLALHLTAPAFAGERYLSAGQPDGTMLLPPPPAPGSAEEAADLEETRSVFKSRTPAEEARAKRDSGLSFALFAPAIGPLFEPGKLPRTEALLQEVKAEIGIVIDLSKDHWKRKRPYALDEGLSFGKPEPSYSYPSGHSTRGTVYALVLSELFSEKRDPILAVGRNIGWDRVLIGKHFPTDVQAGRVLGIAIVRDLMASPGFQRDLAEARKEIAGAKRERSLTVQAH